MSLVYFILLLGGLIFFHEFGHYLLARLMGVHVETFSIGFGPKLFSFKRRAKRDREPTEYVIAALPLGGYVKMLGHDPNEEVPAELYDISFSGKAIWRRFLIVAAGPVFNLILPFIIFFFLFLGHGELQPSVMGTVMGDGPAWNAGLRPGDRITSLDGEEVRYWHQVQDKISARPGETFEVSWDRRGQLMHGEIEAQRETLVHNAELGVTEEVGRAGLTPAYPIPIVHVLAGSVAEQAGMKTWDRVVAVDGEPVHRLDQLLAVLAERAAAPVEVTYLRFAPLTSAGMVLGLGEVHSVTLPPAADRGLSSAELVIRRVVPGSPAAKAGLQPGDRIVSLDGHRYRSGLFFESALAAKGLDQSFELVWERGGVEQPPVTMKLAEVGDPTDLQKDRKRVIHGIETFSLQGMKEMIPNDRRVSYAVSKAVSESVFLIWLNFKAVSGLFTGRVPLKELGGPILIGQLAARTGEQGWGYFFKLMVWLSISLGLINLLPIPILDGGQIVFLGIEAVRRRPVSLRTRQIATYVGMAFILVLMVLVFKNDIERAFFG